MGSFWIRRRAVALVAAYAVAMQALLLAFALPPVARAEAVLCSSHGDDPAQHAPDCAAMCAALAATAAGPLPPAVVVAHAGPQSGEGLMPPGKGLSHRASILGPHAPRGPPHG